MVQTLEDRGMGSDWGCHLGSAAIWRVAVRLRLWLCGVRSRGDAGSCVSVLGVVKRFVVGRLGVLAGRRGRLPLALAAVLAMVSSLAVATPAQAVTVTTPGGFT